ncbi:MAG: hypothetical protein IT435_13210 [Phycisphaerales bacterium]|nr:hypothetical protein [Phycisphaerales bacterium]
MISGNGRFYSLPINYAPGSQKRYCDIGNGVGLDQSDMGSVVDHLTGHKKQPVRSDALAHLDPDLDETAIPRLPGWRPTFGQVEVAQAHLANEGVGPGDVFLFHGWFHAVALDARGKWRSVRTEPDLNVIFGWMQVGEVIDLERVSPRAAIERYPWLMGHPHLHLPPDVELRPPAHALYIATERLCIPGTKDEGLPGAGIFREYHPSLSLTAPHASGRSVWKLPQWFKGNQNIPWLTNYPRPEWWSDAAGDVLLRPRGRQGQEAILNCRDRSEAGPWVASLIANALTTS